MATTVSDGQFEALLDRLEATQCLEALLGDISWGSVNLNAHYAIRHETTAELLADPLLAGAVGEVPRGDS